ncbi:MAG: hypothetical protein ABJA98_26900 [Acidobacteriota bacterium]
MAQDKFTLQQVANDDKGERFMFTFVDGDKKSMRPGYLGKVFGPMHEAEIKTLCSDGGIGSADVDALFDRARVACSTEPVSN